LPRLRGYRRHRPVGPAGRAAPKKRVVVDARGHTVFVSRDEDGRTRTKIIIQRRSYLDPGTEVMRVTAAITITPSCRTIRRPAYSTTPPSVATNRRCRAVRSAGQEQSVPEVLIRKRIAENENAADWPRFLFRALDAGAARSASVVVRR